MNQKPEKTNTSDIQPLKCIRNHLLKFKTKKNIVSILTASLTPDQWDGLISMVLICPPGVMVEVWMVDEKMLNFLKDGSTASYKLYCLYSCDVLQHNNLSNSYWNISVWIKALESVKTPTLLWSCSWRYNMTQISHVPCEHHILSLSKLIYGIKFVLCYHYVASLAIRGIIKWFNSGTTEQ